LHIGKFTAFQCKTALAEGMCAGVHAAVAFLWNEITALLGKGEEKVICFHKELD
jgi:hypothetical protein